MNQIGLGIRILGKIGDTEAHRDVDRRRTGRDLKGRGLNFLYGENTAPDQVRLAYDPDDYRRLAALKTVWDAGNLFRLNANIPPA